MSNPTMEILARRLDRVEQENRRLKRAGVAFLAVIAAVVLMGQATGSKVAKVVEAKRIVLRDDRGTARARLEVDYAGVTLALSDKDGRARIKLDVGENGLPRLHLVYHNGILNMGDNGSPQLTFTDKALNNRMTLGISSDGSAALGLADDKGNYIISLRELPDGPELRLSPSHGDPIYRIPVDPPEMKDFALSVSSSGVSIIDLLGTVRAKLSLLPDGSPEVKLFSVDNKVIWSAP